MNAGNAYVAGDTDSTFSVAVDSSANAYVMGETNFADLPTASPFQEVQGGGTPDVFIAGRRPDLKITGASVSGKKLIVTGAGFDNGARLFVDGQQQKTANDDQTPSTTLIAKKAGKVIARGQSVTIQVQNSDGTLSNLFPFTRTP